MKILKLEIENFMTIGQAEIALDARGLILVQGRNDDDSSANSNGSGKSSILNALCWGLYGVTSHGLKADNVVNRKVGKNCRVCVTVEDDGQRYSIIRHRKHKENKNRVMVFSEDGDITRGTDALTDAMIVRLIGSSKDVFLASIFASQENMTDLPALSDKNLKAIIEESAGVDRLTRAYEIACKRFNTLNAKVVADNAKLDAHAVTLQANLDLIEELQSDAFVWDDKQSTRIDNEATNAKNQKAALVAQVSLVKSLGSKAALQSEIDAIEEKLSSMSRVQSSIDALLKRQSGYVTQKAKEEAVGTALKESAQDAISNAKSVAEKVGTPCSECGKSYCAGDLAHVQAQSKEKAQQLINRYKGTQSLINDYGKAITELDTEIESRRKELPDTTIATKQLNALQTKIAEIDTETARVAPMKAEFERIVKSLSELKAETNPYYKQIESKEKHHVKLTATHAEMQANCEKGKAALVELDAAKLVYSPKGVRNHILSSVTPYLNERTAHYLSALSDGQLTAVWQTIEVTKKGDVRDKFSISVSHENGAEFFGALSGGEKRKVRIATTLALQDLVASRAAKNVELFCGDELDDALDVSGLERLMGILEAKARERGTVMIISHHELKSWISEHITVVKKDGVSHVE